MNKQLKSPKLLILVMILSLMSVLVAGCGDDKYVQSVKNGTMYMAPNAPVGKAFDQFFKNGKWKSFVSDKNDRIVEFTGEFDMLPMPKGRGFLDTNDTCLLK